MTALKARIVPIRKMQSYTPRIPQNSRSIAVAKFIQAAAVVLLTLLWCKAASAQRLYDNFGAGVINPAKWVAAQNYDPDMREALREIAVVRGRRRLHLYEIAYSATTDNNGTSGGLFGLSFPNPSAVTAISFTAAVNNIAVVACNTNQGAELVTSAEFRGSFFNVDASPTSPNDDVIADISIQLSSQENGPTVVGFVTEGNGADYTVLGYQVLGTVALKSTNTLFLQWDQPNHRFIFQLNNGAQVFEPYNVPDTSPPFNAFKNIDVGRVVPHCTSTPRPYALVDADFGSVYVNR